MITFEQVSKRYGERLALDSVSWHMEEGECVVLLGHSGAGKTSILRLVTHEIRPSSGSVTVGTFRGGRLSRPQRALLRRTLGIIYEDFRLLSDRTVFENVALAVRISGVFANEEVIPRVMYALSEAGLQNKQGAFPSELSAGEKQRAAIARAIVNRPAILIADEPTGALEKKSAGDVIQLLRRLHQEGAALLYVTTNPDVAHAIGGRTLVMEDGRITSGDTRMPREPVAPPAMHTVLGGTFGRIPEPAAPPPAPSPTASEGAPSVPTEGESTTPAAGAC